MAPKGMTAEVLGCVGGGELRGKSDNTFSHEIARNPVELEHVKLIAYFNHLIRVFHKIEHIAPKYERVMKN